MDERDLQRAVVAFTISFEPHVPALVDDIVAQQREGGAWFGEPDDAQAVAAARDATAVGVATALSVIRVPEDFPAALPASSIRSLRLAVRRGTPLEDILQTYRNAHATFQEHVFRHAERTGTSMAAVRRITAALFAYYDWAMPAIAARYAVERAALPADGDPEELGRIERVLAGDPPADLPYRLDQRHVAIAMEADHGPRVVAEAADVLGVERLVGLTPGGQTWAWLGAPELSVADVIEALRARIGAGRAGVSDPEHGPHGFAGAHRKALIALRVGKLRTTPVSRYRDVALEALAFGGEEVAADFVLAELGRMAAPDNRVAMLRETLTAYFAHGGSTAATARALGIAERTVTYRLRRAEELIGRSVAERRADLETALRLYDVLDLG